MDERFPQFTMQLSRLNKLIQKLKKEGMGHFGLKAVDTLCLYQLSHSESASFSEVAERCDLDGALVSRTLRGLTKSGMVVRLGEPGKYHARYALTPQGAEKTHEIIKIINAVQSQADEGIDPADLAIFYRVLGQLTANFERMAQTPPPTSFQSDHQEDSL